MLIEKRKQNQQQNSATLGQKRKCAIIKVPMNLKRLKSACCELVTENGRPFSLLEESGFRKIIDPIIHGNW